MADTVEWPLSLDEVRGIVDHLLKDGSRSGIILANKLNTAMGASARRRAAHERKEFGGA